jgi:hypothetical protein
MFKVFRRVPLDPAFSIVDRTVTDVDVAENDDLATLSEETGDAGLQAVQVVELVR